MQMMPLHPLFHHKRDLFNYRYARSCHDAQPASQDAHVRIVGIFTAIGLLVCSARHIPKSNDVTNQNPEQYISWTEHRQLELTLRRQVIMNVLTQRGNT